MNEQIQHLGTQAGLYVDSNGRPYPRALSAEQADAALQKFAELIVRECASMAESFHHHQYDFTGNLELHEFIREHFGVEE